MSQRHALEKVTDGASLIFGSLWGCLCLDVCRRHKSRNLISSEVKSIPRPNPPTSTNSPNEPVFPGLLLLRKEHFPEKCPLTEPPTLSVWGSVQLKCLVLLQLWGRAEMGGPVQLIPCATGEVMKKRDQTVHSVSIRATYFLSRIVSTTCARLVSSTAEKELWICQWDCWAHYLNVSAQRNQ